MTSEAREKQTSNKECGGYRQGISDDINSKVVLVARELVKREAENPEIAEPARGLISESEEKLCTLVKKYFESRRECKVELKEEVYNEYGYISYFEKHIEINDFSITLKFECDFERRWKYTISCGDLGTNELIPHQNKDLAIQGQLKILFFYKKHGKTRETREQIITMQ